MAIHARCAGIAPGATSEGLVGRRRVFVFVQGNWLDALTVAGLNIKLAPTFKGSTCTSFGQAETGDKKLPTPQTGVV